MTRNFANISKTIIVAIIASIIAFAISFRLEVFVADYLLTKHGNWQADKNIVVVTIDENTLATLPYRSPIDRDFLSKLIQKLDEAKPAAIGLDLLIDQASEANKDKRFFTTIKTTKTPLVIGYATKTEGLTQKQIAYQNEYLNGVTKGLVTLLRDNFDGKIREVFSDRKIPNATQLGLAAQLATAVGKKPPYPMGRIVYYNNNTKPDATPSPYAFATYPAHTVQYLPAKWFKDKIVLIGPALHLQDRHATPFTTTHGTVVGNLYGVHIHAHILSQFLNGDRIAKLGFMATIAIVLGLALFGSLIAKSNFSPLKQLIFIALLILFFGYFAFYSYTIGHVQIPLVTPILAVILSSLFFSIRQWFKDRDERQFVEQAFSQYVSPAIVSKIIDNRQKLELGGELREVTYIFTDLENFTNLSEGMEPTQIAELLNDYLDQMCMLFVEADATIDKIIGDAVVGFFGAPQPQEDQAERAVQLALKIDAFSQGYRKSQHQKGINFGDTRIGIHKGDAVIGNFGGKRFMDYTGIGDTVNTAARLESANKTFGTRICISQSVYQASAHPYFRPIGNIQLKGKKISIACFEPLNSSLIIKNQHRAYQTAFDLMAKSDPKALATFNKLAAEYPDDRLINFHATRLRQGSDGANIQLTEK